MLSKFELYKFLFILRQVKPLDEALSFDNGHICKTRPTEIVRFYMQSVESSEFFRGVVNTDVTMVKATPSDDNNNTVNTSSYPILVELTGRMAGQRMEQTDGDEQVHLSLQTFHLAFINKSEIWNNNDVSFFLPLRFVI